MRNPIHELNFVDHPEKLSGEKLREMYSTYFASNKPAGKFQGRIFILIPMVDEHGNVWYDDPINHGEQ